MMATVQIRGLDELSAKLEKIIPAVKRGVAAGTVHIKGKIATYPRSTKANDPSQPRWYERGWGPKWHVKGGSWHGVHSSETLGRKWTSRLDNNGLTGVVGNNVSYGPYVQGEDEQADALKRIGWKTTSDIAEAEKDTVTNFIKAEIDTELRQN